MKFRNIVSTNLVALVGGEMFLVSDEQLVKVLVQGEEGRVTGLGLVVLQHTGGNLATWHTIS